MPRYDDDDDLDDLDIRRRRREDYRVREEPPRDRPESGMGIISLLISIVVGIGMFALIAIATAMTMNQPQPPRNDDPAMIIVGLGIIGGCGLALVGLVLGVMGAMQSNRRGMCGILGSIFNGLILLGVGALMCIGLAAG